MDQCPSTFLYTTTYYGAFPNIFSSSDALLLVNGALSPTQKLQVLTPHIYILILNHRLGWILQVFNPLTRIIREGPESNQPWTSGPSAGHRVGRARAVWSGL